VPEQERPLAEVVQEERRKDEAEPGDAYRPGAEVPHVGVDGLAARDDEEDRTEDEKPAEAVCREEPGAVKGDEGLEHLRSPEHVHDAENREGGEPEEHHGPKKAPIRPVPFFWMAKRTTRTATDRGITSGARAGLRILSPSTAERTEIDGVIRPSP